MPDQLQLAAHPISQGGWPPEWQPPCEGNSFRALVFAISFFRSLPRTYDQRSTKTNCSLVRGQKQCSSKRHDDYKDVCTLPGWVPGPHPGVRAFVHAVRSGSARKGYMGPHGGPRGSGGSEVILSCWNIIICHKMILNKTVSLSRQNILNHLFKNCLLFSVIWMAIWVSPVMLAYYKYFSISSDISCHWFMFLCFFFTLTSTMVLA